MDKKIIEFITIVILIVFVIVILNISKNKCIKNGGKVVTDNLGIYEKCIYEEKNE